MSTWVFALVIAVPLLSIGVPQPEYSKLSDGGCVLTATNGEVWLRVYQETGNADKGNLVWDGHLDKGGTHALDAQPNDRIRYDYKIDPNDAYHGNVGATCQGGQALSVP